MRSGDAPRPAGSATFNTGNPDVCTDFHSYVRSIYSIWQCSHLFLLSLPAAYHTITLFPRAYVVAGLTSLYPGYDVSWLRISIEPLVSDASLFSEILLNYITATMFPETANWLGSADSYVNNCKAYAQHYWSHTFRIIHVGVNAEIWCRCRICEWSRLPA